MNWKQSALAAAAALTMAGVTVHAQSPQAPAQVPDQGPRMGPGMMHGYGTGWGAGQWYGGRGEQGMGWGMMHGRGMGPHMMGDDDWGRGIGPGMGPEMISGVGLGPIWRLDLDDAQRKQVVKLRDELRRKNWDVMGRMQDEMSKLRDAMWAAGKRDRAAILAANKRMFELRQQMLENGLDAADKADALLTAKQREELRRLAP